MRPAWLVEILLAAYVSLDPIDPPYQTRTTECLYGRRVSSRLATQLMKHVQTFL